MTTSTQRHTVPTSPPRYCGVLAVLLGVALTPVLADAQANARDPHESSFMAENDRAMTTMMDHMSVKPSGDIDRDFVAMMQPHHQGAIDMAEAELRYGHNEQLRRIAQEIIVDQQQEITAMSVAIQQTLPPQAPAPTQPSSATNLPHSSLDTSMPAHRQMSMHDQ